MKRNYQETKPDIVIVIARRVVIDVAKATVVGVATDQAIAGLE